MPEARHDTAARTPSPLHENTAIDHRNIVRFAIGVVVLIAAAMLMIGGLDALIGRATAERVLPVRASNQTPPAPRLEAEPREGLTAYEKAQRAQLEGYGWVDRSADIAHIPVDRAMDLLVKRSEGVRP